MDCCLPTGSRVFSHLRAQQHTSGNAQCLVLGQHLRTAQRHRPRHAIHQGLDDIDAAAGSVDANAETRHSVRPLGAARPPFVDGGFLELPNGSQFFGDDARKRQPGHAASPRQRAIEPETRCAASEIASSAKWA